MTESSQGPGYSMWGSMATPLLGYSGKSSGAGDIQIRNKRTIPDTSPDASFAKEMSNAQERQESKGQVEVICRRQGVRREHKTVFCRSLERMRAFYAA